jgi:Kef-type K+ transport system membrane component KefB
MTRYRLIWILLFIAVLISTVSAVSYALVRSDWSGVFTIGSYMVGCGALMLALLSVGEFMGLKRPDAFSYAYDTVTNSEVFNQYTKNLKKGPRE